MRAIQQLWVQVLIGIALAVALGIAAPGAALQMKPLGDAFIALLRMLLAPIIFCSVVLGLTHVRDMGQLGRLAVKALLYFEVMSTLAMLLGFLISTLAFVAIPVVVVLRILGSYLPGFGSVTIAVLLLGGIQLIALGIIGEYVGRIYDEVKGRPLYLVRAQRNLPEQARPHSSARPAATLTPPRG